MGTGILEGGGRLRGDGLWDPQEMWQWGGKAAATVLLSARDEAWGFALVKQKEKGRPVGSLPGLLAGVAYGLAEGTCCSRGWNAVMYWGREVKRKWSVDPMWAGRREGCSWCSVAELGMRLGH